MTHNQRVEKHIDLAEFSDARLNGRGGRRWILHVEPRDQNVVELGQVLFLLRAAHRGDDVPAFGEEVSGGLEAVAGRAASNEHGLHGGHASGGS